MGGMEGGGMMHTEEDMSKEMQHKMMLAHGLMPNAGARAASP